MPGSTTDLALPYPLLTGDPPNVPADIQALAEAIDAALAADGSHTQRLTGADVRCTLSARTDLLSATFTLDVARRVMISGKTRLAADPASGADGVAGLAISVDGTQVEWAGPITVPVYGATHGTFVPLTIPSFLVPLAAGSHTVKLQVDRDGSGVVNALATSSFGSPAYKPTTLGIILQ